ncbi:RNA polymerase sigma factor [Sphingomonas colocasiae]|uniref:RNA polymerase sigma factor n=1 Tax=Sphingomonas colocasiae TaxID=1848973 RepID=UPI001CA69003
MRRAIRHADRVRPWRAGDLSPRRQAINLVGMTRPERETGENEERGEPGADTGFGAGFDAAYRAHWRELCSYVLRNFGSGPPDPEDVAQQAFMRLSGVGHMVDNVGSFLRRIARNLVIDHHRRGLRTSLVHRSVAILEDAGLEHSPEDLLSSKEQIEVMNEVIAALPVKERVAFLMHRVDGAPFTEIARDLGVSHSGARLLVSRALERCATAMGDRR